MYPGHKFASKEELSELRELKRRLRSLKTDAAKERIRVRIKAIEEVIRLRNPETFSPTEDGSVITNRFKGTESESIEVNGELSARETS